MAAKVSVRVMKNGVVVHRHAGANGYHDPSRKHEGATDAPAGHKALGLTAQALANPEGLAKLTAAQKAQHTAALAGQTFWIYPAKAKAEAASVKADAYLSELEALGLVEDFIKV